MKHLKFPAAPGVRALSGVALLLVCSCAERSTGPGSDGAVGLSVVPRPPAGDTVAAAPVQAIVVQLRDDSRQPIVGATVRFTGLQTAPGSAVLTLLVRLSGGDTYGAFAAATTNTQGQTSAQIEYGSVAGPGRIEIAVPELGTVDTLTFTVQPGNLATVAVTPRDTAIHTGATVALIAHPQDRFGNIRPVRPPGRSSPHPWQEARSTRPESSRPRPYPGPGSSPPPGPRAIPCL